MELQQDSTEQTSPNRESIKHLLIGLPKAVKSTIHPPGSPVFLCWDNKTGLAHNLQVLGYAQVGAWSPLLPTANPGEVMSILSRLILVQ